MRQNNINLVVEFYGKVFDIEPLPFAFPNEQKIYYRATVSYDRAEDNFLARIDFFEISGVCWLDGPDEVYVTVHPEIVSALEQHAIFNNRGRAEFLDE